ncbi:MULTISPECIES: cell division protein FtsL [unclassified Moraxella]|uniref:cell division protein FtsL n=1 Tax=unclassified Moraxella TaxID=2685852 RepID=UPI003AF9F801
MSSVNPQAITTPNAQSKPTPPVPRTDIINMSIIEVLESDYRGVSLYTVAMGILVIAILWTGVSVVEQIQSYHHRYGEMSKLKKEFRQLQVERQRMLIEQQTFSATPQVTQRAVAELNMFYPDLSDRMIVHANQGQYSTTQTVNQATAKAQ